MITLKAQLKNGEHFNYTNVHWVDWCDGEFMHVFMKLIQVYTAVVNNAVFLLNEYEIN